eukprot:TRINITY_DN12853_c0_g1_i1.p1 TRINITY_DN12853_c0_g1~~TRINITY_DN12853_c0_g1_i1.p1  ORF type:complete len:118 (+),score=10.80 TRINITY_DN12853_c0_g1_i1:43-396(+)
MKFLLLLKNYIMGGSINVSSPATLYAQNAMDVLKYRSGAKKEAQKYKCKTCEGSGKTTTTDGSLGMEMYGKILNTCVDCLGFGETVKQEEKLRLPCLCLMCYLRVNSDIIPTSFCKS